MKFSFAYPRLLIAALCPFLLLCAHSASADTTNQVAAGVTFIQRMTTGNHPLAVNILRIDLKEKTVHVRSGQAMGGITLGGPTKGREQLHALAARQGAIAGINADFFPFTGDPLGLELRDGELISEPMEYRACLGLSANGVQMAVLANMAELDTADGAALAIGGINRVPHGSEIVALCPVFAAAPRLDAPAYVVMLSGVNLPVMVSRPMAGVVASATDLPAHSSLPQCPAGGTLVVATGASAKDLAAHVKVGDELHFRFDLVPSLPAPTRGKYTSRGFAARGVAQPVWTDVNEAVGGGPWLVHDGKVAVDWESEGMDKITFVDRRHPRTAVGVTADGVMLLIAVDGRSPISQGATLDELAVIVKSEGAVNAINMDGGGSTSMVVQGSVVNAPSDGRERPIADGLLVYSDAPLETSPTEDLSAVQAVVIRAGDSIPLAIGKLQAPMPDRAALLWGTADGLGFVNQLGIFQGTHAGNGSVVAHLHGQTATIPVSILPADPAIIKGSMSPIADFPPYYAQLTVTVTDRFGNGISGVKIKPELAGGQLDSTLVTDANGHASSQIVWDVAPEKRLVKLNVLSLKPVIVRQAGASKTVIPVDPDDRIP